MQEQANDKNTEMSNDPSGQIPETNVKQAVVSGETSTDDDTNFSGSDFLGEMEIQDITLKDVKKYVVEASNDWRFRHFLNHDDLRDYGAVAGKYAAPREEALESIRRFYSMLKAKVQNVAAGLQIEIQEQETELKRQQSLLAKLQTRLDDYPEKPPYTADIENPYSQKVVFYAVAAVGLVAVAWWLGFDGFDEKPYDVSRGLISSILTLIGLAVSSRSYSFMLHAEDKVLREQKDVPEKWKVALEELGLPVAVALTIAAVNFRKNPLELTISGTLMLAFGCIYIGQGLFKMMVLKKHRRVSLEKEQAELVAWESQRQELITKINDINAIILSIEQQIRNLRSRKQNLRTAAEFDEEAQVSISVFNAEYDLAKNTTEVQESKGLDNGWAIPNTRKN